MKKIKQRDFNILLGIKGEIKLNSTSVRSKKVYTRKDKHKGKRND